MPDDLQVRPHRRIDWVAPRFAVRSRVQCGCGLPSALRLRCGWQADDDMKAELHRRAQP